MTTIEDFKNENVERFVSGAEAVSMTGDFAAYRGVLLVAPPENRKLLAEMLDVFASTDLGREVLDNARDNNINIRWENPGKSRPMDPEVRGYFMPGSYNRNAHIALNPLLDKNEFHTNFLTLAHELKHGAQVNHPDSSEHRGDIFQRYQVCNAFEADARVFEILLARELEEKGHPEYVQSLRKKGGAVEEMMTVYEKALEEDPIYRDKACQQAFKAYYKTRTCLESYGKDYTFLAGNRTRDPAYILSDDEMKTVIGKVTRAGSRDYFGGTPDFLNDPECNKITVSNYILVEDAVIRVKKMAATRKRNGYDAPLPKTLISRFNVDKKRLQFERLAVAVERDDGAKFSAALKSIPDVSVPIEDIDGPGFTIARGGVLHLCADSFKNARTDNYFYDLLKAGADLNATTTRGQTPLLVACKTLKDPAHLVDLLIRAGADVTIKNNEGKTAADFLEDKPELKVVFDRALERREKEGVFGWKEFERKLGENQASFSPRLSKTGGSGR